MQLRGVRPLLEQRLHLCRRDVEVDHGVIGGNSRVASLVTLLESASGPPVAAGGVVERLAKERRVMPRLLRVTVASALNEPHARWSGCSVTGPSVAAHAQNRH